MVSNCSIIWILGANERNTTGFLAMKVISGGQTGSDQAGLAAAKELGLETGGWLPKGYMTAEGPRPDLLTLYNMKEHPKKGYPPRTERNVIDSDATVIFGDADSPGCTLTRKYCKLYTKPVALISFPGAFSIEETAIGIANWIAKDPEIFVLNIAGNRESKNPGIFEFTKAVLLLALQKR